MREDVEHYSQIRALQAAERSDVAIVVADATEGLTEADLAAVDRAARAHCATLLVMNKWDLAQPDLDHIRGKLRAKSRQRPPVEVASAVTGEGLHRLLPGGAAAGGARPGAHPHPRAQRGAARAGRRAARAAARAAGACRCATWSRPAEAPPTFRLDVNDRSLMTRDYGFWLENRLRQRFDLDGVPLVLEVRTRP